jgi:hypothetical protein
MFAFALLKIPSSSIHSVNIKEGHRPTAIFTFHFVLFASIAAILRGGQF